MSLKDIDLKIEYNTLAEDAIEKFYNPCLSKSTLYQRVTAYFSSAILTQITYGLSELMKNEGKMQLVISHQLDVNEYEAMKEGYISREINKLNDKLDLAKFDEEGIDRFGLLSYLIQENIVDIKIAFITNQFNDLVTNNAILHTKTGIFKDDIGNAVAFIGSVNETYNGYASNHETFDVYRSWLSDESNERCASKIKLFDRLWNNSEHQVKVIPFPDIIKEKLLTCFDKSKINNYLKLDNEKLKKYFKSKELNKVIKNTFLNNENLREYQIKAIDLWEENKFNGVLDMATGTGKTFTACGAINRLKERNIRKITIICAPFKHLVDQWGEEVSKFGFEYIKCYDRFDDYFKKVEDVFRKFKLKLIDDFCILITNSSFKHLKLQKLFNNNSNSIFFIVDEAHNFGAYKLSSTLEVNYKYRLALSATINRHNDISGSEKLLNYFDKIIFSYTLEEAIKNKMLTPYYYYPIVVYLNEDELDEYKELTFKIRKCYNTKKEGNKTSVLERLLIKRARLVASTRSKVDTLINLMKEKEFCNENNMLIYCGAVNYDLETDIDKSEENQIDEVVNRLKSELGINSTRFTSKENSSKRSMIIKAFESRKTQALVAIKCLDEGVNIPAIKKAFILASSTNPKEYIQRKGRVLRLYEGKYSAEIYDFITLPRPLSEVWKLENKEKEIDYSLIKREFSRLKNFNSLALNSSLSERLMIDIKNEYEIIESMEEEDEYDFGY